LVYRIENNIVYILSVRGHYYWIMDTLYF
jgi:hypothetical protein